MRLSIRPMCAKCFPGSDTAGSEATEKGASGNDGTGNFPTDSEHSNTAVCVPTKEEKACIESEVVLPMTECVLEAPGHSRTRNNVGCALVVGVAGKACEASCFALRPIRKVCRVGCKAAEIGVKLTQCCESCASTCFPGDALVTTVRGTKRMRDLQVGDEVGGRYPGFYMFTHRIAHVSDRFFVLEMEVGALALTGGHLVYVNGMLVRRHRARWCYRTVKERRSASCASVLGVAPASTTPRRCTATSLCRACARQRTRTRCRTAPPTLW